MGHSSIVSRFNYGRKMIRTRPAAEMPPLEDLKASISKVIDTFGEFNIRKHRLTYQGLPFEYRKIKWATIAHRCPGTYGFSICQLVAQVAAERAAARNHNTSELEL